MGTEIIKVDATKLEKIKTDIEPFIGEAMIITVTDEQSMSRAGVVRKALVDSNKDAKGIVDFLVAPFQKGIDQLKALGKNHLAMTAPAIEHIDGELGSFHEKQERERRAQEAKRAEEARKLKAKKDEELRILREKEERIKREAAEKEAAIKKEAEEKAAKIKKDAEEKAVKLKPAAAAELLAKADSKANAITADAAAQAEVVASKANEKADEIFLERNEKQQEVITPKTEVQEQVKVASVKMVTRWKGQCIDLTMLVQAVAAGDMPIECLVPNDAKLNEISRTNKRSETKFGVRYFSETKPATGRDE